MARGAIIVLTVIGTALAAQMAALYAGHDSVALGLVIAITVGLWAGAFEQWRGAHSALALGREVKGLPHPATAEVVAKASALLRPQLRAVEAGQRPPPPTAQFTPFLLGLLVMLGMLGTFLGLVDTLAGAGKLMANADDADALRRGLSAPISGLTKAFGTSVAGVGASAALGLASVFTRRLQRSAHRLVVDYAAGAMSERTPLGRQLCALETLSEHFSALPRAADGLHAAVDRIEHLGEVLADAQKVGLATAANTLADTLGARLEAAAAATREGVQDLATTAVEAASDAASTAFSAAISTWAAGQQEALTALRKQLATDRETAVESLGHTTAAVTDGLSTQFAGLHAELERVLGRLETADSERAADTNARLDRWRGDVAAVLERFERADATHATDAKALLDAVVTRFDDIASHLQGHESKRQDAAAGHLSTVLDRLALTDTHHKETEEAGASALLERLEQGAREQAAGHAKGFELLGTRFDAMLSALADGEVKRQSHQHEAALELQQILAWQAESQASAQTVQLQAVTDGFAQIGARMDATENKRGVSQLEQLSQVLERLETGEQHRSQAAERRDLSAREAFAALSGRVADSEASQAGSMADLVRRVVDAETARATQQQTAMQQLAAGADARDGLRATVDADRFETLSQRLSRLMERVERGEAERLATIERLVTALEGRADTAEQARDSRASQVGVALAEARQAFENEAASRAEAEAARLGTLEKRWADLSRATEAGAGRIARQTEAALDALRAPLAQLGAEARAAARTLAEAEQGRAAALGERLDALGTQMQDQVDGLSSALATVVATSQAAPEAAAALVESSATRLAAQVERDDARDIRLDALATRLQQTATALTTADTTTQKRLTRLANAAEEALTRQTEEMSAFEARIASSNLRQQSSLATQLSQHTQGAGAQLEQTTTVIAKAAELLRAGSGELSAVAELFSDAVDAWRDNSERMLTTLSELESTLGENGRDDAEQMVGEYVDQTREVFGDAMRFQRELFTELRALRDQTPK